MNAPSIQRQPTARAATAAWHRLALAGAMGCALSLCAIGPAHAGSAQVKFLEPDRYTDAGHGAELAEVQAVLTRHLQGLAAEQLPANQLLLIEIRDIDLAGDSRPWARLNGQDLRVLRGRADWPRINLHYSLREGDRVLASGDEQLADMAYLMSPPSNALANREALPYERRMLSAWFAARFSTAH